MMSDPAPLRTHAASGAIKVAAWCETEDLARTLRAQASAFPEVSLSVDLREKKRDSNAALDAHVLILDLDLSHAHDLEYLAEILAKRGQGRPVVATSARADVAQVRQLLRLGVGDFLAQPITHAELEHCLRGLMLRVAASGTARKSGAVITVLRPVGGTGATTIATHLAFAMAAGAQSRRIALVDLDLQNGAVGLYLDITTDVGVVSCLDRFQDIEPGLIKSVAFKHASGADVLVATHDHRPLDAYPPQAIEKLLETMRSVYDVIIVDTPSAWTHWHGALLAQTEMAVVVLQKTVANLRHGRRLVNALKEAHLGNDQIVTVCNRVPQTWFTRDISHADTEAAIGTKLNLTMPSDYSLLSEAANLGVHVSRIRAGTKFEKAISVLGADLDRRIAARDEKMPAVAPAMHTDAHLREAG